MEGLKKSIVDCRDNWLFKNLKGLIWGNDLVLDLGAGNSCLGHLLERHLNCRSMNLEVAHCKSYSKIPVAIYNGIDVPFKDNSFDVVLLLFVLHHAAEPAQVLREAKRICRRSVIVFEDYIESWPDLLQFRIFHKLLAWNKSLTLPRHELNMEQWSRLAGEAGLKELRREPVERQMKIISPKHVVFRWDT